MRSSQGQNLPSPANYERFAPVTEIPDLVKTGSCCLLFVSGSAAAKDGKMPDPRLESRLLRALKCTVLCCAGTRGQIKTSSPNLEEYWPSLLPYDWLECLTKEGRSVIIFWRNNQNYCYSGFGAAKPCNSPLLPVS